MKHLLLSLIAFLLVAACSGPADTPSPIIGTWMLLSGTTIKGKDTTVTDYTKGQKMIKIITPTHFAFLRHDLSGGKDSTTAVYVAGGGRAAILGNKYTEHLDFFNAREWEGGTFEFDFSIKGDTLTTTGIEKVEALGIEHLNIERYVRER